MITPPRFASAFIIDVFDSISHEASFRRCIFTLSLADSFLRLSFIYAFRHYCIGCRQLSSLSLFTLAIDDC